MANASHTMDTKSVAPVCAYCGKPADPSQRRPLQLVAIGRPGRLDVRNDVLHPDCERGYLRLLDDPAERR